MLKIISSGTPIKLITYHRKIRYKFLKIVIQIRKITLKRKKNAVYTKINSKELIRNNKKHFSSRNQLSI